MTNSIFIQVHFTLLQCRDTNPAQRAVGKVTWDQAHLQRMQFRWKSRVQGCFPRYTVTEEGRSLMECQLGDNLPSKTLRIHCQYLQIILLRKRISSCDEWIFWRGDWSQLYWGSCLHVSSHRIPQEPPQCYRLQNGATKFVLIDNWPGNWAKSPEETSAVIVSPKKKWGVCLPISAEQRAELFLKSFVWKYWSLFASSLIHSLSPSRCFSEAFKT